MIQVSLLEGVIFFNISPVVCARLGCNLKGESIIRTNLKEEQNE